MILYIINIGDNMKLNNKGFAASIILYSIVAVIVIVLVVILSIYATNLRNKTNLSDKVKYNIAVYETLP